MRLGSVRDASHACKQTVLRSYLPRPLPFPCARSRSSSGESSSKVPAPRPSGQQQQRLPLRVGPVLRASISGAHASAAPLEPSARGGPLHTLKSLLRSSFGADSPAEILLDEAGAFFRLSSKFMPMVGLFFLLAFNNTILDSLKDTLVITASGGGPQVIPYLTTYAVLPSSVVFLFLYSVATQNFSRAVLFNGIVAIFMAFFVLFGAVLYPHSHHIHLHAFADSMAKVLPSGLDGLVGMVRNWTFTMFFCMSELWGDVCLGLLFWGLANDTTSLSDAATMYPLFGIGANIAQSLAGLVLKLFSGKDGGSFTHEIQSMMTIVMVFCVLIMALHTWIDRQERIAKTAKKREQQRRLLVLEAEREKVAEDAAVSTVSFMDTIDDTPVDKAELETFLEGKLSRSMSASGGSASNSSSSSSMGSSASMSSVSMSSVSGDSLRSADLDEEGRPRPRKERKKKVKGLRKIFQVLMSSVPIQCLAVMSLAQGLCTNLMEFAWKSHISMLYPTASGFTAFLGDVSTLQGLLTGVLMILSPALFKALGWRGVAAATPFILLWGGGLFFGACCMFQCVFAPTYLAALSAVPAAGGAAAVAAQDAAMVSAGLWLKALVFGGALLYVFSKSAKFSLFKPAEEMVYISLDREGRTKGKAAIDVVGAQTGKSGGSILQQVLLLVSGGAIAGSLPIMFAVYFVFVNGWLRSVNVLSDVNNYGHESSVHSDDEHEHDTHEAHDEHSEPHAA